MMIRMSLLCSLLGPQVPSHDPFKGWPSCATAGAPRQTTDSVTRTIRDRINGLLQRGPPALEGPSAGRKRKPYTKACSSGKRTSGWQPVFSVNYAVAPRRVACTSPGMYDVMRGCEGAKVRGRAPFFWVLVLASACATPASPTEMPEAPVAGGGTSGDRRHHRPTDERRAVECRAACRCRSNSRLMEAAQLHADQMVRLGRLEHVLSGAQYPAARGSARRCRVSVVGVRREHRDGAEHTCRSDGLVDAILRSPREHPEHQRHGNRDRLCARLRRPALLRPGLRKAPVVRRV